MAGSGPEENRTLRLDTFFGGTQFYINLEMKA